MTIFPKIHGIRLNSIDPVILNLLQDLSAFNIRPRNKFGVTRITSILTFMSSF